MIGPDLAAWLGGPLVVLPGVVSPDGVPTGGLAFAPQGQGKRLCILVADAQIGDLPQRFHGDVVAGRRITVTCTHILELASYQFKGTVAARRDVNADDRARLETYRERFLEAAIAAGIPPSVARNRRFAAGYAVDVDVARVIEQTPGARAGVDVGAVEGSP